MKLENAVVLVTGANRGIGLAFARQALARGARKVYAGARDPSKVTLPGVIPIKLDVTDETDVAAAAAHCADVTLVVNNAGVAEWGGFMADDAVASARRQLEVNFFGILHMARAFGPVLAKNGGGGLIDVLSVVSWINRPALAVYGATKSAAWGLTNALRNDLAPQGTQVLALHMGFVDTDLTAGVDAPKATADSIVAATYDGLEAGELEVRADDAAKAVHAGFNAEPPVYLAPPPLPVAAPQETADASAR
jgi:NAD(P)-dependent dehydrogenase (short-subunit alcohol dehydrogenase family)